MFHLFSFLFNLFLPNLSFALIYSLVALVANIVTIIWFLRKTRSQNNEIQNLQLQLTQVNNKTSLQFIQNQIKWITNEQLNKILSSYNEYNDKLYESTQGYIKLLEDKVEELKKDIPDIYFENGIMHIDTWEYKRNK